MENVQYKEYNLVLRSKATFKTDRETIRVWDGQKVQQVAERIAEGYGAEVVEVSEINLEGEGC